VLHQLDVPGLPSKFARPKTKPKALSRSRLAIAGGAAVVVLAVGAAVALIVRGDGGTVTIGPTSVGVIDPESNRVVDEIALGSKASLIAAGEGFVWLADRDTSTLVKIDPQTREIVRRTAIGATDTPTGIAVGEGAVWLAVLRGRVAALLELGPEFGNLRREIVVGRRARNAFSPEFQLVFLTVGEGAVWTLEVSEGEVSRIDPATGQIAVLTDGVDARSIAAGRGAVWLGGTNSVTRMDPTTGAILASFPVGGPPRESASIAVGAGAAWFASSAEPKLWRIGTQTNAVTDSFAVGAGPVGVAVGEGAVWVANSSDGTVSRVNPGKSAVDSIALGVPPGGVVAAYGAVWTSPGQSVR
jgi:DNA-binding beta-propeller fold protein YncE